jgi:uncharacterized protein YebE (UPF0316 family)
MVPTWTGSGWTLPAAVFLAEMCVVTLGTLRIIFIARGRKPLAACLGFFEIVIWLFAISQVMRNLNDLACFAAFAGGFTLGNYLGIKIEEKLAMGSVVVRTIWRRRADELVDRLRSANFGVTTLDGEGATGPVQVVFTIIKRKQLSEVVAIIKRCDPRAFYSVEDVRTAAEGIFPAHRPRTRLPAGLLGLGSPARSRVA